MTLNEYLYIYANDKEDCYHPPPKLDISTKISRIKTKRFVVKAIDKNYREMFANKIKNTRCSLNKLQKNTISKPF